jgi:hypothetical protein
MTAPTEPRSDVIKLVLPPEPADELVKLLVDEPGEADEQLLDNALDALDRAAPRIDGSDQKQIAEGHLVAVQLEPVEAETARELIESDVVIEPKTARRLADRLRARIRRARRRRNDA